MWPLECEGQRCLYFHLLVGVMGGHSKYSSGVGIGLISAIISFVTPLCYLKCRHLGIVLLWCCQEGSGVWV